MNEHDLNTLSIKNIFDEHFSLYNVKKIKLSLDDLIEVNKRLW